MDEQAQTTVENRRKVKLWVKITAGILAGLVGVIAILGFTFLGVWHNEISAVNSMTHLRGAQQRQQRRLGIFHDRQRRLLFR